MTPSSSTSNVLAQPSRPGPGMALVAALLLGLAFITATVDALAQSADSSGPLRVGVYHNPPKLFLEDDGTPSGIWGDLLHELARREGWQLSVVPCNWNDCLEQLAAGDIDLMPDVARTPTREQRFNFHETPALLSWSQLYQRESEVLVASLLDVEGMRLAVLNGSVQQEHLLSFFDDLEVAVQWIATDSLESAFEAVKTGQADVVAANQFYGDRWASESRLARAPVVFQPSELYFAAPPGARSAELQVIDEYLRAWRANPDSVYFDILRRWEPQWVSGRVPEAFWWLMALLVIALIMALGFGLLARRQVADRTSRLLESESRLNTILNSVDAHIYIKDRDFRYQYANRKVCELLGVTPERLIGERDEAFFDADTCRALRANDIRVLERGERFANEEVNRVRSGADHHVFLSVKLPLTDDSGNIYALCGISTDITELRHIQDQLHQLSFFDSLTGLPNRRLLLERLDRAQQSSGRTGYEGALVLVDIDGFKTVNDSLGHQVGDQLLCRVAERLSGQFRSTDTLGRLGSDEFAIVLEDLSLEPEQAMLAIEKLVHQWLEMLKRPYELAEGPYVASVSIGIALFSDTRADTEALLKAADLALFAAKSSGRNQFRFFNPDMQVAVNRRTRMEAALRTAIEQGALALHLQPQVDSEGRVLAMEALMRWQDPQLGPVSPGEFIPLAETSGLIVPLGEWAIERACDILAEWGRRPELEDMILAVNISPAQFRHPNFVEHIEQCLERTGIVPARLELEITESLLIDEMQQTIERMQRLGAHGIRFALDDFGTGYASLSYLKRLPLHLLKIDQSFVEDLLEDPNDEAIVRTILALGQGMELSVLAEGVETAEQARQLRTLGCSLFQGYYYGRPAALEHWQEMLSARRGSGASQ